MLTTEVNYKESGDLMALSQNTYIYLCQGAGGRIIKKSIFHQKFHTTYFQGIQDPYFCFLCIHVEE